MPFVHVVRNHLAVAVPLMFSIMSHTEQYSGFSFTSVAEQADVDGDRSGSDRISFVTGGSCSSSFLTLLAPAALEK